MLNQPPGQEDVVGEARPARLSPVRREHLRRLLGYVHHLRHARLHPVGEFILGDSSEGFRVAKFAGLPRVEFVKSIEREATHGPVHAWRIRDKQHRISLRPALHPLIHARQEA